MATRVYGAWSGNRVYAGTYWMDLYHSLELELTGGGDVQLTGNGKIPNGNASVIGRHRVQAVFDGITQDNNNTFTLGGGVWPSFSGTVSIPSVIEAQVYNQTVQLYPAFGSQKTYRVTASLTGIDRVPGTTSFDKNIPLPARAWAKPNVPTIIGAEVIGSTARLNVSGHQNNQAADKYWQRQDKTVYDYALDQWIETQGLAGSLTYHSWPVVENNSYQLYARTWNEDGGLSAWSSGVRIYTKPTAPTGLTAVRRSGNRTTVDLSWNNTAAHVGSTRIMRWSGSSWVEVGSVSGTGTTWSETVPFGDNPLYRVVTRTPDNVLQSDVSATATPAGYLPPDAPAEVTLTRIDDTSATITVAGNQSNPSLDGYWATIEWGLETDTGSFVPQAAKAGDATSWTITGLAADHRYRVRARSGNDTGLSAWTYSGYLYTTPDAVSSVVATRAGVSSTTSLTWTNNALWAADYLVERRVDSGAWTTAGTPTATNFTDDTPPASPTEYRVSARTPAPVRSSATTTSNALPPVGFDKEKIPGIVDIFLGSTKVYRVMANDTQIWLG